MVRLELQYLYEIGRVGQPPLPVLDALQSNLGLVVCDASFPAIVRAVESQTWTRDPFDRLIVAQASLFDAPLQKKFHDASRAVPRNSYDLRELVTGTMSAQDPVHSVTFVENHDTQPLQALEQVVEAWFKPWAYAFILLRDEGYPCIFHADWTGADYADHGRDGNGWYPIHLASHEWILRRLLAARRHCAWGEQRDYFDHRNTVGWSRLGDDLHPHSLGVVISNGTEEGWKWMEVGRPGAAFVDLFGHREERIVANEDGWARFTVNPESCSVWVAQEQLPDLHAMLP